MDILLKKYMNKLTKDDVATFAYSKNIFLNNQELEFTYNFIKKNWQDIIKNPAILNLERYKSHYSSENFSKIQKLFQESIQKYSSYLR